MTNFNAMLLEHTDVTLVSTNNQEVPCHRFILAARSPVFKRYVKKLTKCKDMYFIDEKNFTQFYFLILDGFVKICGEYNLG